MGKIRWTEKSSTHLQAIHAYIAVDSPVYAARFIEAPCNKLQEIFDPQGGNKLF